VLTDTALDSAASALADATTALGSTKIDDFLSGASIPSAKGYLLEGDDFINEVTLGVSVAERYAIFAQRAAEIAATFIAVAREHNSSGNGYVAEASGRIAEIDRHLGEADRYAAEAASRISDMDRYLGEADRYIAIAMQNLGLADKFKDDAIERRNEAWAIWRDPKQYIGDYTISSVRQQVTE
ncbi:unnamed protein product, partial [marine sediment metagenome]